MTTRSRRHAAALAGLLLGALSIPAERAGAQESSEGSYELGLWKRVNSTDLLYVPLAVTRKDEIDHAEGLFGVSYVWKDGWTVGAYYVDTTNKDYYKRTPSLANTDVKDLARGGGYITVGRTF